MFASPRYEVLDHSNVVKAEKNFNHNYRTRRGTMKHLFLLLIFTVIGTCYTSDITAQNYVSKTEAVKRLADEAKYAKALLDQSQDSNEVALQRNRLRVITALLHDLKSSESVSDSAAKYVPSADIRKLQVGVGQFSPPTNTHPNHIAWLQDDIMQLLTY